MPTRFTPAPPTHDICVHHWLLEAPKDGYIEAHCRRCNELKIFAATGFSRWNRTPHSDGPGASRRSPD